MDGRTDNVKTVYPPQTKFAGGIIKTLSTKVPCKNWMDRHTIPQAVYDSDGRYVLKWISVSITFIYIDNLNLVPKT